MVKVIYGCCTNSLERVNRWVRPRIGDRELIVVWDPDSLTVGYNQIIAQALEHDADALVLLHDDLELIDSESEAKLLAAAAEPDVALVGVAGGRGVRSLAWWNYETVGYQRIENMELDFGPRSGDVDSLEGSLLLLTRWSLENLRFDETFIGYHGYDEIGLAARRVGKRVVVANIETFHHTRLGFDTLASEQAWYAADAKFREKYGL